MIHHVSIGVKDLAAAKGFYDKTLAPLGIKCLVEGDSYLGYGAEGPEFWVLAGEASGKSRRRNPVCTFACRRRAAKRSMAFMPRR